ncbi:MAG: DUF2808 domain-containing protein [Actinobacteria bacterium]|nr:MAG: DUF2808 domain-containing protein [Actinomycetota bacterium]
MTLIEVDDSLTAGSFALATIRGHIPGLWIEGVSVSPSNGKITIYFNKAVPAGKTVTVGWLVAASSN